MTSHMYEFYMCFLIDEKDKVLYSAVRNNHVESK